MLRNKKDSIIMLQKKTVLSAKNVHKDIFFILCFLMHHIILVPRTNAMWGEFCVGFVYGIEPEVFLAENLNTYFSYSFHKYFCEQSWAVRKSQIRKCSDLYNLLDLRTNRKYGTLRT